MKYWTVAVAFLPYAWIHVYFKRLTAYLYSGQVVLRSGEIRMSLYILMSLR